MSDQVVGSIGVGLLLLAFALNLLKVLTAQSRIYLLMNLIGSLLAAWYAWAGQIYPFVVLELVWGGAALGRLLWPSKK